MRIEEIDIEKLTPMMRQYVDIKLKHPDKILFFRLGEFYEMFFEDAIFASNKLEIALTKKSAGLEERIPMCGVPAHSYISYLEKLVDLGYKVAIVEQLENAGSKKLVERGIVQVVSPGTIVKEDLSSSYIGSYYVSNNVSYLTYANISTGEMYSCVSDDLYGDLKKYDIKELVLYNTEINDLDVLISYIDSISEYSELYSLDDNVNYGVNILISYIESMYGDRLIHMKPVQIIEVDKKMNLSVNDINTLELVKTIRNGNKFGSLYWYLDKTSTAMGSRLLKSWIESPLLDVKSILKRQDYIEVLLKEYVIRTDIVTCLKEIYDIERIVAKLSIGNVNARDLIWLKNSLIQIPLLNRYLNKIGQEELNPVKEVIELIESVINDEPPISIKDGNIIKKGYNAQVDELREINVNGKQLLIELENREKEKTGIKNLKVKYNRVFGYFIEISNANLHLVKDEFGYERKQTITNGERFITSELKEHEDKILNASERSVKLEYDIFVEVRNEIRKYIRQLQLTALHVAYIDCICSLAVVADSNNLVKPSFNDDGEIKLIGCKHPVVENANKQLFVANDVIFESNQSVMLITGPNMSGKSTYMRQVAITAIMAQIGSYVACESANIMLFDSIFTRIGASDDLSSGKSTFMVEMIEANHAIVNATKNSLILFDELGRGTSTYDGISISEAIIAYISKNTRAKTLFSTHYHELTKLENESIFNVHASAIEENGEVIFKHLIEKGPADKSYGVHVAKLAGLNSEIISSANILLKHYESTKNHGEGVVIEYVEKVSEVEESLAKVNVDNLTPLDALNLVHNLKKMI